MKLFESGTGGIDFVVRRNGAVAAAQRVAEERHETFGQLLQLFRVLWIGVVRAFAHHAGKVLEQRARLGSECLERLAHNCAHQTYRRETSS